MGTFTQTEYDKVYREVTERVGTRATSGDKRSTCRRRTTSMDAATAREQRLSKSLVGCLNDTSGRFKSHGLVKKVSDILGKLIKVGASANKNPMDRQSLFPSRVQTTT